MSRKHLIFLLKLAVSASLLAFVLSRMELTAVSERLAAMSEIGLFGAIACLAVQAIGVVTWRWHAILRLVHKAIQGMSLARMVVVSLFFNQVLPTTFGGDGMRIWLLSRQEAPLDVALRSVVLDRVLGLFGLFLLCLAASLSITMTLAEGTVVLGALLLSVAGVLSVLCAPLVLKLLQKLPFARLRHHLATFSDEIRALLRARAKLAALLTVSVVGHLVTCFAVWLTAWSLGIEVPLGPTLAVVPLVLLAASLPISIAGWGVRESSMVFGLGLLGVASGDAALVSVMVGLMGIALGGLGGLMWLLSGSQRSAAAR